MQLTDLFGCLHNDPQADLVKIGLNRNWGGGDTTIGTAFAVQKLATACRYFEGNKQSSKELV